MKIILNTIRKNPNSIQEIILEDVASYEMTENEFRVTFNTTPDEVFPLRDNDGEGKNDWFGVSIFVTRIGLKIDFSK